MLHFSLPFTLWDVTSSLIELRDHENMGVVVGISPLSSLLAEIHIFPVAISGFAAAMLDFQLPVTLWDVASSLMELGDHENVGVAVGISSPSSHRAEIWLFLGAISGLATTMLDFPLSVTLWDVTSSLIELGNHESMGVAVGISSLSSQWAEI